MGKYEINDFCNGEIQEYEGTYVPKFFWALAIGLLLWGLYYFIAYIGFVPEAMVQ